MIGIEDACNELDKFIDQHKSNLSQYIVYININYYDAVKNALNFDLNTISLDIRTTTMLETKYVAVIVDKKVLDWGNITLERRELYE